MNTPAPWHCEWLLPAPGQRPAQRGARLQWNCTNLTSWRNLAADDPVPPRGLVLPALANAHDHARGFRNASLGAFGEPLESWLPFLGWMPPMPPYLCAATSLARSARHGVVNVLVHYTRVQGGLPYLEEAREVGRAARDVGVHIGFAVALRDRQSLAYAPDHTVLERLSPAIRDAIRRQLASPALPVAEQLALVEEVAAACADYPMTVQYGPTGVQWCSNALLEGVAQASSDQQRPVHMHLLETRRQRQWADHAFPGGIVHHLDQLGLLTPQLTLAHCTWCRPDELALLAERGVTIAVNTSSNLLLGSGIAPFEEMQRQGCRVAMGLDGLALDEDDDAWRELRLTWALHRGREFRPALDAATLWRFAAVNGRRAVTGELDSGGVIDDGAPADLIMLDWDALNDDGLWPDHDPWPLILARANGRHINKVVASGRLIVDQGRLLTVDETALTGELHRRARHAIDRDSAEIQAWRRTLATFSRELEAFYHHQGHCCG